MAAISVAVSAATLFIVISVSEGIDWDLAQLVESIGSELFTITPRSGTVEDSLVSQIADLSAVDDVGGSTAHSQFFSPSEELLLYLAGVTGNYFQLRNLPFLIGHGFDSGTTKDVAVLGNAVAAELFPDGNSLGRTLDYRGHSLLVVGVLEPVPVSRGRGFSWGFALEIDNPDNLVYVPQAAYEEMVSLPIAGLEDMGKLGFLWVRAKDGCLRLAMDQVSDLLVDDDQMQVRPLAARYDGLFHARRRVSRALAGIAVLILLISSIGVASVLGAAVLDRHREIGIRRALGARRSGIASMVLRESSQLVVSGGGVGAILGALLLLPMTALVGTTLRLGMRHLLFLGAIAASGLLAGVLPAFLASLMDPARAIACRSSSMRRLWGLSLSRVLSGISIGTGVAMVIVILALGDANTRYLKLRWLAPEPGVLRVRPGIGGFRQPASLSFDDFNALASLEGVDTAVWMASSREEPVKSDFGTSMASLVEITPGASCLSIGIIEQGRNLSNAELNTARPVVVLGAEVSHDLYPDGAPIGQPLELPGLSASVVGVLACRPGLPPYDFVDINRAVFVPRGLTELKTDPGHTWIWLRPEADRASSALSLDIVALMSDRHPDRGLVEVIEPAAEMESLTAVQTSITRAQALLAGLGVAVATAGTGSTIWLSVLLKQREIAIRKAIGARRKSIFRKFVDEALRIAATGSGMGLAIGTAIAWLLNRDAEVPFVLAPWWLTLTASLACLVAFISSAVPAYYAACTDPAVAIRSGER